MPKETQYYSQVLNSHVYPEPGSHKGTFKYGNFAVTLAQIGEREERERRTHSLTHLEAYLSPKCFPTLFEIPQNDRL